MQFVLIIFLKKIYEFYFLYCFFFSYNDIMNIQVKIIMKKNYPSILKKQQLNHSEWEHIVDEVTRMYELSPEEKQLLSRRDSEKDCNYY